MQSNQAIERPLLAVEDDPPAEIILRGIPASPGVEYGPGFLYLQKELEVPLYHIAESGMQQEIDRFQRILAETRAQINVVKGDISKQLGESEARIFDAHLLVLEDKTLFEETLKYFRDSKCNIEYCLQVVSRRYINALDSVQDEFVRERVTDIRDVTKRLLLNMIGSGKKCVVASNGLSEPHIIVSERLTPTEALYFSKNRVMGIATDLGSRTSHAVIIARSLGVPAVVGLHNVTWTIDNSNYLLIDGYEGVVVVNPSRKTLLHYGQLKDKRAQLEHMFTNSIDLVSETADGVAIDLMANIDGTEDVEVVRAYGAGGVGLFRTEGLFMKEDGRLPSSDEQFKIYKSVIDLLSPLPITIRTMDIGGDKQLKHVDLSPKEENPFMGLRAVRFCLQNPEIFKEQLRAILRVSAFGKVRLMYPMISSVSEVLQIKAIFNDVTKELTEKGIKFDQNLETGIMIEIPSAALMSPELAKYCAFFSVGTNDLIQYLLAVDRVNDRIAHLYEPHHPAVLRMLKMVIENANVANVPLSICGEMAGDPLYMPLLIGLGVKTLSMAPIAIPEMKSYVRNTTMDEAKQITAQALKFEESKDILELLRNFQATKLQKILEEGQVAKALE